MPHSYHLPLAQLLERQPRVRGRPATTPAGQPPFLPLLPPSAHTHLQLPEPRLLRPEPPLCPQLQESRWSRQGNGGQRRRQAPGRGQPEPAPKGCRWQREAKIWPEKQEGKSERQRHEAEGVILGRKEKTHRWSPPLSLHKAFSRSQVVLQGFGDYICPLRRWFI